MKKFKFRYEQLLKIRARKVDDLKNELGQLSYKLNSFEEQKRQQLGAQANYFDQINQVISQGCSAQELIRLNNQKLYFNRIIEILENDIRDVKLQLMQVRDQLNEAVKEQKIMEKLKEKERERYFEEIELAETKITEEIVNYINYKGREE